MLHLYYAALFSVLAANVAILVVAVAIKARGMEAAVAKGLSDFRPRHKKGGDPCENPSLSTQRLRHNQGPLGSIPEGSIPCFAANAVAARQQAVICLRRR
jgi:hypothetical protein